MCAATSQMVAKVAELMELRKMIEDLNAEAELLADEIKAYMGDEETMTAGSYVVRYLPFIEVAVSDNQITHQCFAQKW